MKWTKILILLTLLIGGCGSGDETVDWTPDEPPSTDEVDHDDASNDADSPMATPFEAFKPVVELAPGVALTCATAAFKRNPLAYVLEFRDDGTVLVKTGPAHGYRQSLDSSEDPVRGPIDQHEARFEGRIGDESVNVSLPLFDLELDATHPGYFRGRTHLADHGEEDIECWTPNFAPPFRYDGETGKCRNQTGDVGWNQTGVVALRETGFGECADLRGVSINEDNLSYPIFQGLNFAGANLEGGQFFFALLEDADLRGTHMLTLEFGYARLSGEIDAYSRVTEECIVNETKWVCRA